MVRFDVTRYRYLSRDDFRVLQAVEMGMKNHEVVPTTMILRLAALKKTNGHLVIATLAKYGLIHHENKQYDGYKLTYMGYDFLAIRTFVHKGLIKAVGQRVGVGKESDVYEVLGTNDEVMIMKVHRLGRVCFSNVRQKRDYLGKRRHASFMYMSRLAAVREFAYLKALYDEGFPTPVPYEVNRHCILMSRVNAKPLHTFTRLKNPVKVYNTLMNMLVKFAQCGLIHCDFNEFNLLLGANEDITVIDFPQMISVNHPNAKELFDRDALGIRRFFNRKLGYEFEEVPIFQQDTARAKDLDLALKASGHTKMFIREFGCDKDKEEFERIMSDAREMLKENFENGFDDEDDEDDNNDNEDDVNDKSNDLFSNSLLSTDGNLENDADGELLDDEDGEEMVFYDEEGEEEYDENVDDRVFMRARHAKNAQKYNPVPKYLKRAGEGPLNQEDEVVPSLVPEQQQLLTAQQLSGLTVLDNSPSNGDDNGTSSQSGALYTKSYILDSDDDDDDDENNNDNDKTGQKKNTTTRFSLDSDDDSDEDENEDDEDEDDEEEGARGFRVGQVWFATRGEKKAYLKRQKDLEHIMALRKKRETIASTKDQVKNTVKYMSEKQKEREKNKNRKIAKTMDKRTKKKMRDIQNTIRDSM